MTNNNARRRKKFVRKKTHFAFEKTKLIFMSLESPNSKYNTGVYYSEYSLHYKRKVILETQISVKTSSFHAQNKQANHDCLVVVRICSNDVRHFLDAVAASQSSYVIFLNEKQHVYFYRMWPFTSTKGGSRYMRRFWYSPLDWARFRSNAGRARQQRRICDAESDAEYTYM
jgi:hypothetical protein